jgi:hypothetical protein
MGFDYASLLYGPLYAFFGKPLTFRNPATGAPARLTAIDMTSGVETKDLKVNYGTTRPACAVRVADVAALGLAAKDFDRLDVALNGVAWRVEAARPAPGPDGEASGELVFILIKASC